MFQFEILIYMNILVVTIRAMLREKMSKPFNRSSFGDAAVAMLHASKMKQVFSSGKLVHTTDSDITSRGAVWTGKSLSNGETRKLIPRELGVTQEISYIHESGA